MGDPALLPLLDEHDVVVETAPVSGGWLLPLLSLVFPFILLGALLLLTRRRMAGGVSQTGMFDCMKSRARRYVDTQRKVTFDSVAGADEAKENLQQVVDFLINPQRYHDLGARIPRGVLLVGPPGTGKTLMARAVAGEANVPFFSINASEFVQMFVGVGAGRVRDLFEQAKEAAPSIIFIDELTEGAAGGRHRQHQRRTRTDQPVAEEMDGFGARQDVVMAPTGPTCSTLPSSVRAASIARWSWDCPTQGRYDILRSFSRSRLANDVDLGSWPDLPPAVAPWPAWPTGGSDRRRNRGLG